MKSGLMSLITTANTFNLLLPCIRFKEDVDNWILFPYFLQQNKKKIWLVLSLTLKRFHTKKILWIYFKHICIWLQKSSYTEDTSTTVTKSKCLFNSKPTEKNHQILMSIEPFSSLHDGVAPSLWLRQYKVRALIWQNPFFCDCCCKALESRRWGVS